MLRLELQKDRNDRHAADAAQLSVLKKHADRTHGADVLSNRRLRQAHRVVRHEQERLARKGKRLGIGGPLVASTREDIEIARRETRRQRRGGGGRSSKRKTPGVRSQSIFAKKKVPRGDKRASSSSSSSKRLERAMQQLPRGRFAYATMSASSSSDSSLKVQVRKRSRQ